MPEVKNQKLNSLLSWIRLCIPIAIAAIGWYVGQVVSEVKNDISELQQNMVSLNNDYIGFKAKTEAELNIRVGEYNTRIAILTDRLSRLENRVDADGRERRQNN